MRIYGPKDRKLYNNEERMRRVRRNLILANSYEEFQNSVLSCVVTKLKELGAKKKVVTIAEIKRLSEIDVSNNAVVGRLYSQYFSDKRADTCTKRGYVRELQDSAKKDALILDMLSQQGIDNLREWFYREKYGMAGEQ